jgi:hypothetical protein
MYAGTNRCYNECGSRTNYVQSSIAHCILKDGRWMCLTNVDWSHVGSGPYSLNAPRSLLMGPLCRITIYGSAVISPKFQMTPRLTFLIFSGSMKKEPRYASLSKAKALHRQRIWGKVSFSAPHFLHNGLSAQLSADVFLRVLCLVRRMCTSN